MPKPMMMSLQIEEIAFGSVFRKVRDMPGVISIDLEAESFAKPNRAVEAPTPGGQERYRAKKSNGTKRPVAKGTDAAGTSLRCILLDYINEAGRACPSVELQKKATDADYAPSTYSNVIYGFGRHKLAKKTKHGWVLTAKGKKYLATECKIAEEE